MEEVWKDVPGFEGNYQASNLGRVRSLDKVVNCSKGVRVKKGKILTHSITKYGYHRVVLYDNSIKRHILLVSRIIYETFVGPIPEGMQVNHIDENKNNNNRLNLNLLSAKDNTNWGTGISRRAKKQFKPVTKYLLDGTPFFTYFSIKYACEDNNIKSNHINMCCAGERKQCGGFKWRYAKKDVA